MIFYFFFSSRRRHTRFSRDWSSDVCSSDLRGRNIAVFGQVDQRLNDRWRWSLGLRAEQRDADYEDEGLVDESEQRSDLSAQIGRASCREREEIVGGDVVVRTRVYKVRVYCS